MLGLLAVCVLLASCSREQRPLVVLLPGNESPHDTRVAFAGAIKGALEHDLDIELASQGQSGRRPAGYIAGAGASAPSGVPVVALPRPGDTKGAVAEIHFDNTGAGRMAGDWAATVLIEAGDVAVFAADLGAVDVKARVAAFDGELKRALKGTRIVHAESVGLNKAAAGAALTRLVTRFPAVRVLYTDSDPVAEGVVEALKAQGNTKVRMIGFASSESLIDDLRRRVIDGLLMEDRFSAGYEAVGALARHFRGELVPKRTDVPMQMVRRFDLERPEVIEILRPDLQSWSNRLKLRR